MHFLPCDAVSCPSIRLFLSYTANVTACY